jgi:hypothetical protein
MSLPDANFLAAPLWLVTTLHVLTLSLHFVAMNFILGGILLAVAPWFNRNPDNPAVGRFIALFPSAMAATVTLGVAPLLFLQLVYPRQIYAAAIVSGWFWLLVIPAVIIAYYFLYAAAYRGKDVAGNGKRYLWPALLCLLYVSLLYSSVFSMAERPDLVRRLYAQTQTGLQWNPQLGDYVLRWLHMILGAVTVAGFFAALLGRDTPRSFSAGNKIFAYGMGSAAAAGLAYLVSLRELLPGFMRTTASWLLAAGILLSLASLHFFFRRRFLWAGLALLASLVLMVSTRHQLRLLKLQGQFDPASWRIAPEWPVISLFAAFLIIAVLLVVHMLRLFFRYAPPARSGNARD